MKRAATISAFILFVIFCDFSVAHASDTSQPRCQNGGIGSDRLVPNKQVAEAIYRAVGTALVPENFKKFPIVVVGDAGDHWAVSQTGDSPKPEAPPPGQESVMISAGGGQLLMDIDKCTGAMTHAALNR